METLIITSQKEIKSIMFEVLKEFESNRAKQNTELIPKSKVAKMLHIGYDKINRLIDEQVFSLTACKRIPKTQVENYLNQTNN